MNGKQALLRKMIIQFGDTFAAAIPTLHSQIAAGSLVEARRLAHTLKGVAGAIEIGAVAEAAGQIEDALADGTLTGISGRLDRLEQVILPALAASGALKQMSTLAAASAAAPIAHAAVDYTASMPMITEVRGLLQRRSLRARKAFDTLEQSLGTTPEAVSLRPVKAALDRLDYGEALILLDETTGWDAIAGKQSDATMAAL